MITLWGNFHTPCFKMLNELFFKLSLRQLSLYWKYSTLLWLKRASILKVLARETPQAFVNGGGGEEIYIFADEPIWQCGQLHYEELENLEIWKHNLHDFSVYCLFAWIHYDYVAFLYFPSHSYGEYDTSGVRKFEISKLITLFYVWRG